MLTADATPFFAEAGFKPFKTILLLEGDARSIAIPRRREHDFRMRRFHPQDLEEVLRVDEAAFDAFWKLDAWNVRSISRYCDLNNFLVAEGEGGLLGYCIAGTNRYSGFIQRLAVRPEHQGRGLGKALLLRQAAWLRGKGARVFLVNTQEENLTAQRIYRETGFNRSVSQRYIYRYEHDDN
jgi:[ribosomal protein S18]-alanine N-acetyltransferase